MNIALLHYSVPPVVGGVEAVIGHHARLMSTAGHHVSVIAGRGEQFDGRVHFERIPQIDSLHPDVLRIKAELDRGEVTPEFEQLRDALMEQIFVAVRGMDVLIAHNVCSLHKNLPLTAALHALCGKPDMSRLVLWHHDLAWVGDRYRNELHAGYPWDLLRLDWPAAQQVVVSTRRQQELVELLAVSPDRVQVVPNGIDIERFYKLEEPTVQMMRHLQLAQAAPLMLLPVRITTRKNIEMGLHILARLRCHMPQAKLLVTGPLGPHNPANVSYFHRLQDLRSQLGLENVAHFLAEYTEHYLPDAVIADFFRLADCLILPSIEEGFGIPILEAGLARLPVFCSDIESLRELGGRQVTYFPLTADPEEVAKMISLHLSSDPVYALNQRTRISYTWEGIYKEKIVRLLAH